MNIQDVQPGMTILEPGGGKTLVRKVQIAPGACKTKVHINEKDCYEGFADVRIQEGN